MRISDWSSDVCSSDLEQVNAAVRSDWRAGPLVPGAKPSTAATVEVTSPADRRQLVGHWQPADAAVIAQAMDNAVAAQPAWDATPVASRAAILEHAADLLEQRTPAFMALCTQEAGKTIPDGVAEVREAVDFLRYYAGQARTLVATESLPSSTGETNTLHLARRGVFAFISPCDSPLGSLSLRAAPATGRQ